MAYLWIGVAYALLGGFSAFCWQGCLSPSCYLPYKPKHRYWPDLVGVILWAFLWPAFEMLWLFQMLQNNIVFLLMANSDEWHQYFRGEITFLPERMRKDI